jgi:peptidoglycan/LPS O-acetylase OafA/YrhL
MNRRFVILDFYRYLAAVGIVLFHAEEIAPGTIVRFHLDNLGFFVDFFFILSGFVITHAYGETGLAMSSYRAFILRRVARIYPLHLVTTAFYVATALALPRMTGGFSLTDLGVHLTLTQGWGVLDHIALNGPSWSISAELFCYLLFPFFIPLIRRLPGAATVLAAALLYGVLSAPWPFWDHDGMFGAYYDFGMLRALPSFLLGCGVYRLHQSFAFAVPAPLKMWAGAALFVCATALMILGQNPYLVLAVFALSILLTASGERDGVVRPRLARACEWLGDCSYALYLVHYRLLVLVAAPLWAFSGLPMWLMPAWLVLTLIALTMLARVIFVSIERPARRALLRRMERPHAIQSTGIGGVALPQQA